MLSQDSSNKIPSESLRKLMLEAIRSPRRAGITVTPRADNAGTEICVRCDDGTVRRWKLLALPRAVSDRDIRRIRRFLARPARHWTAWLMMAPQLLAWSVGLTGLFAASTMCPCCGQFGCALGVGTMGVMGGVMANVLARLRRRAMAIDPKTANARLGTETPASSTAFAAEQ